MGRLDVVIPDELERELRIRIVERLGGEKGTISRAVAEAIRLWLKEPASKRK